MRISVVVGNPKPGSRTLGAAVAAATRMSEAFGATGVELAVFDLAEYVDELFDWESTRVSEIVGTVMDSDVLVFGSPTFKATYTGMLKVFLDRIGGGALTGRLAVPMMVAGGPQHALAVETSLRPLLVELGATCVTPGLCLLESQLSDVDVAIEAWWSKVAPSLRLVGPTNTAETERQTTP